MSNNISEILECLRNGEIIMVSDDPDRENECDLICSAEHLTTEQMAFIIRYSGGIVCVPCSSEILNKLEFNQMVSNNTDRHQTSFTVSVDYTPGTTTGISASDRTKTIKAICSDNSNPQDFQKPGHVFPLLANPNGILERRGHTETSIELMKLAKLKEVAVISELLNDDGTIMCGNDLKIFSETHNLKIISVKEVYDYLYNKN